jgi:hypothetical protein
MTEDFYKDKAWELLMSEIIDIKASIKLQEIKIDRIDNTLSRIIGYSAGAGAIAGIVIAFIKDKVLKI